MQEWNESNVDFGKRLSIHKVGIQNILQSITAMEAEFQANKEARTAATAGELEQIRAQVCTIHWLVTLSAISCHT